MSHLQSKRYLTTKKLTIISASINTTLAFTKILVGYFSHSEALMTDGIHSFSDLINDALVLFTARWGGQSADKEHPYGHQRIETIGAILLAVLMLSVGISIGYRNLNHVFIAKSTSPHTIPVIIISLISIIIYELLARYNRRIGEEIHSNLLISNSYHNRSDAYTSLIVVFSAIGTAIGNQYFDAFGAIIIAAFIIKMGTTILWHNLQELIDAGVDEKTYQEIHQFIGKISGVVSVHQLRTRMHSGNILVDAHIIVSPFISVSEGHHIGETVHLELIRKFSKITDVTIHVDPEDDEKFRPCIDLPTRSDLLEKLKANCEDLPGYKEIKTINIHYLDGRVYLEIVFPFEVFDKNDPKLLTQQYQTLKKNNNKIAEISLIFSFE